MKFLFCYIIFACSLSVTAQSKTQALLYHSKVNEAELFIIDSKYKAAMESYDEAFKYIIPFAKDYYNATLCAVSTRNNKKAYAYLRKLAEKGLRIETIVLESDILAVLKGDKYWSKFVKEYDRIRTKQTGKFNLDVKNTLTLLYNRDQYFRVKTGSYKVYSDTIKKIDSLNNLVLKDIIAKYGYPSEELTGIDSIVAVPNFDIVIWHQNSLNLFFDYTEILQEAVFAGRLTPHRASELIENQTGKSSYGTQVFYRCVCEKGCSDSTEAKIRNKLFYSSISLKRKQKIDSSRHSLGLETYDDYVKKALFDKQDSKFKFFYGYAVPKFSFSNESELLSFIHNKSYVSE